MIRHLRQGSPPRLMALQSILRPNRRESLPTPSAGDRMTAEVRENPGRSRFELDVGGQTVFARYPRQGSTLVIPTCEVSPTRSARHRRSQLAHDGVVGDRAPKV